MQTTKRIPPPPARSFSPNSPNSELAPVRFEWAGDTSLAPGNITARLNRRPMRRADAISDGDYRSLMFAPAGR